MLPLQFLLLTVRPVVVMQLRHRAGGLDLRIVREKLDPPRPQLYQFFAPTFRRPRVCCW